MKPAVIVTGASQGIGKAIALEYSRNGYFVFLIARNKEKLIEVAQQCQYGATVLACDLTDAAAVNKRIQEAMDFPQVQIKVLVNNAGIYRTHETENGTDAVWSEQFEVNVLGPVRITRALWPYFKKQGSGSIVNISSTLGINPTANTPSYSASKAAMNNWTLSLALEGGPHHIRANAICPGIVDTPIHGFHQLQGTEKTDALKNLGGLQPLGRIGTPEDIAKAAWFLGSDQSSWTTGAILNVDGGINL